MDREPLSVGLRLDDGPEQLAALRASGARGWLAADVGAPARQEDADARLTVACGASDGRLSAVPTLLPPSVAPSAAARAAAAVASDAPAVRIRPQAHAYPLAAWVLRPLPERCDRAGRALLVELEQAPLPWDEVVRLARAYPSLPLVLVGPRVGEDLALPAALEATTTVLVALGHAAGVDAVAAAVARFGAHRFVLAQPTALAALAQLDEAARDEVACGNAEALAQGTWGGRFL